MYNVSPVNTPTFVPNNDWEFKKIEHSTSVKVEKVVSKFDWLLIAGIPLMGVGIISVVAGITSCNFVVSTCGAVAIVAGIIYTCVLGIIRLVRRTASISENQKQNSRNDQNNLKQNSNNFPFENIEIETDPTQVVSVPTEARKLPNIPAKDPQIVEVLDQNVKLKIQRYRDLLIISNNTINQLNSNSVKTDKIHLDEAKIQRDQSRAELISLTGLRHNATDAELLEAANAKIGKAAPK